MHFAFFIPALFLYSSKVKSVVRKIKVNAYINSFIKIVTIIIIVATTIMMNNTTIHFSVISKFITQTFGRLCND